MPKEHLLSLNGNCNGNNGPVTCPECSKTFSKRDHLVRHQRTHTGDKPYACPVCGKSYARSDVARRHIAAHGSSFGGGSIRTASGSSSTGIPFPEGVPEPISGSPMFGMAGQQETETKPSVRGQSPAYTSPVSDQDSFNGDVNMLDHLSLDSSPSVPAPAGASSSSTSAAAPSTSAARVPQSSSLLQQEQHGPNEDAQLLANLSSNAASGANTSYAPYFPSFQSAHPQQQQHHQPPPPQPQQQQQQQPPPSDLVPSLDSVEWDQQLRDIFQGFNASTASSSAPFQVHNGDSLAPLADLSNTPLFDFSVLLSPEGTCHRLANMRPHTPPPAVSNEPPAERLMTIWPTRPSRRTRKTNTASVAQDQTDSHKLRQQQEQNGFDPHEVDPSTAQRMYAHLQGGGILFTKPLPTPEQLTDLLALYFEYVHPIWPMLHPPTFCPATSSSLLMLNMAALGAVFLRTPEGDSLAAAIMEKMHESLSFCMSAQLELYLDPADQDVLALTQAYMMRQLYWLTSGDRNQLEATQLFHSTVANVARRAGLFAPDAVEELEGDHEDAQNDEAQWRHWVAGEVRRRTALCFMLNDLTYAAFFMIPPYCSVGSIAWPLTTSDEVFEARTVEEWKHYRKLNASNPSVPLYTSAASLFGAKAEAVLKAHQKSGFSLHLLVGSITSVVLSTRVNRPNLENEMAMEPKAQMPVTAAMTSAYNLLTSMGDHDSRFYTVVMWHWCYMHLVCDIRMIELACGREGPEIAAKASKRAGPWAESSAARRAVLHCVSVLQVAKQTAAVGSEVPPHVYVALFQAWMIMRTYARFFPSACLPRNPRWGILGSYGASGDTGKPPNVNIPDAAATDWIRDGTQATPITGTKINRAMQDVLSTMRRIGYTKLRVMLSEVIEAIAQADSQGNPSGQYASPNFQ